MNALPDELQLDALREVANIGCGHAASALGRLMGGRRVDLALPRALVVEASEVPLLLGGGEAQVVAVRLSMEGALRGVVLLVLPARDGEALGALLTGGGAAAEAASAVLEAGNIVASACLSAIGQLTGWRLLPSVPTWVEGRADEVLQDALHEVGAGASRMVVLEARFSAASAPPVAGQLLLVLERDSSCALLARLGV